MPTKKAIALGWTGLEEAPVILASGRGEIVGRMLEIARRFGIETVTDAALAEALSIAEIGACVPQNYWEAVASIFAFLERGLAEKWFAAGR